MISWIKNHKIESSIIFAIILVAAFLRFYDLSGYMTFLGDEGRDALMIKRILVEHDLPLIGPTTSVGNIYLGPLYYYMMTIPMAIFWLNPIAAVGMVALIGVLTTALIYFLSRRWFGFYPAILSSLIYAVSFVAVLYARSSWNPNPAPLFALLAILGLDQARRNKNFFWFILTGISLSAVIQMHYLALILLPIFCLFWFYELIKNQDNYQHFFLGTIMSVLMFFVLILPLIIFDFKYNFLNFRAMSALFGAKDGAVGFSLLDVFTRFFPIYIYKLIGRYVAAENTIFTFVVSLLVFIPVFLVFIKKKAEIYWPISVLTIWLVLGIVGMTFYNQSIFDHYLGFLSPVPFLLLGVGVYLIPNKLKPAFLLIALPLVFLNLQKSIIFTPPQNQLSRTQEIAKFVINKSDNKPFNFALIAKNNYDSAYQFYLDLYGHKPKVVPVEITDQLFVVCEDTICDPTVNPKYEIAGFGMSKITETYEVKGLKIFKLVANPSGKPSGSEL